MGGCVKCVCVLNARQLVCLYLFWLGFACGFTAICFKQSENPPSIQQNKYAWLVILLQFLLPADRVTWSLEA